MKAAELKEKLGHIVEGVSVKQGIFTLRKGFFYTHGNSADKIADRAKALLSNEFNVEILETRDIWKPFRGGDSLAKGSHFLVRLRLEPKSSIPTEGTDTQV